MSLRGIPPELLVLAVGLLVSAVGVLFAGNIYWIRKLIKKVDSIDHIERRLTTLETEMRHLKSSVKVAIKGHRVLNDMMTKSVTALKQDMDWVRERLSRLDDHHERKAT